MRHERFAIGVAALLLFACVAPTADSEKARTAIAYHVDADAGDDARSGLSPTEAWKTLERASQVHLGPGDALLLKRGGRWSGTFRPRGSGTTSQPVRIASYGSGPRPRLDGGAGEALLLENASHVVIQSLDLTNSKDSGRDALWVRADRNGATYEGIAIVDCLAHDAGRSGIHVGDKESAAYRSVSVRDCEASDNQDSGIFLQGIYVGARMLNAEITGSSAHRNGWDGIKIFSAENGTIERCVASGNGWKEDARVGIWCWDSKGIVIRNCESFANRTPGMQDGAGFDIDFSCTECVIEYCNAHDNEGAGYLFMGAGKDGLTTKSAVRYCTSTNDGLKNAYGGIVCYGNLTDSVVHDNTIVFRGAEDGAALQFRGDANAGFPSGVRCFKNSIQAEGGRALLRVPKESAKSCTFDANVYTAEKAPVWLWEEARFEDFAAFRAASGQEAEGRRQQK